MKRFRFISILNKLRLRTPRIIFVCFCLLTLNYFIIDQDFFLLRLDALKALQSTTIVLSICVAITLAIFSNNIKGLRDSQYKHISTIIDFLNKIHDKYKNSNDLYEQEFINEVVFKLPNLEDTEWHEINLCTNIIESNGEVVDVLSNNDDSFFPTIISRMIRESNELNLILIRRRLAVIHIEYMQGTFLLIGCCIVASGFSFLAKNIYLVNYSLINIYFSFVVYSIIEFFVVASFFDQLANDETIDDI